MAIVVRTIELFTAVDARLVSEVVTWCALVQLPAIRTTLSPDVDPLNVSGVTLPARPMVGVNVGLALMIRSRAVAYVHTPPLGL
jgi:hypothetical protein